MSSTARSSSNAVNSCSELQRDLHSRPCPVCGNGDESNELYQERIDASRIDSMSFASRKEPEYMNLRMVVCPNCDLLYAPRIPSIAFLTRAYADTGYDSSSEAQHAADTYATALRGFLDRLPDRKSALEIGTGNGAMLEHLQALGFEQVVGIEPSHEAARSAAPGTRELIRIERFDPLSLPARHFSLIVANQTLEHIDDPFGFLRAASALLKPGGLIMMVSHNFRHWLMRALGARSPIVDIEHLQIFSPVSLSFALHRAGFTHVHIDSFANRYPLHYWVRLLPLPRGLKQPLYHCLRRGADRGIGRVMLRAHVGNMMAVASAP